MARGGPATRGEPSTCTHALASASAEQGPGGQTKCGHPPALKDGVLMNCQCPLLGLKPRMCLTHQLEILQGFKPAESRDSLITAREIPL